MNRKILLLILPLLIANVTSCSFKGPKGETGETGSQGEKGEAGADGADGYSILTGNGVPGDSLGNIGDSYIDLYTYNYYVKNSDGWILKGNIKGENGKNGKDGSRLLNGKGVPSPTLGNDGDTYIDLDTFDYYVKDSSGWILSGNIKGSQGEKGETGTQGEKGEPGVSGKDGDSLLTGNGIPGDSLGNIGDSYINLDTYDYYVKDSSGWVLKGNIKGGQGEKGEAGETGKDGLDGKDGNDGVSIANTYVDDYGHLICVMSDGSTIDAGQVKDVTKYKVNFYVDDERIKTLYDVPTGTKITTPNDDETAGYKINYWKCKENNDEKWIFSSDVVTSEINLYADFTYNDYTITYVDSKYNSVIDDLIVTYDKAYSLSTIENKTGYTFNGWKTADGNVFETNGTYRVPNNLTLYADWKQNSVVVTFNSNGGSISTPKIKIAYGSSYELPNPVASTDAYFKGWYIDDTLIPSSGDNWMYADYDITLTARYYTDEETKKMKELGMIPSINEEEMTLTYGLYPQTRVSDEDVISGLSKITRVESNGWFKYNGEYYSQFTASPYSTNYKFDDGTEITKGNQYWFKCEPIKWNIIGVENDKYFLVSNTLLNVHEYSASNNFYNISSIRTWLNGDFYDSAFGLDDSFIQSTDVDNSASTTDSDSNKYDCENTNDKVYLLGYKDYLNSNYGFSKTSDKSNTRKCKTTDYARANGAYSYGGYGYYWTRSPYSDYSDYAWYVYNDGSLDYNNVNYSSSCVRPSLQLKVS